MTSDVFKIQRHGGKAQVITKKRNIGKRHLGKRMELEIYIKN